MFGSLFKKKLEVRKKVDEFTGSTTYSTNDLELKIDRAFGLGVRGVKLAAHKMVDPADSDPSYYLTVSYFGEEWVFIDGPLLLSLDGRSVVAGVGSSADSRDVEEHGVYELAIYPVEPDVFGALGGATSVRLRISGQDMHLDGSLPPVSQELLVEFAKAHVTEGGRSSASDSAGEVGGTVQGTKECPMCAETVRERARICRFCRHEFPAE